jgi:hypothetical protein
VQLEPTAAWRFEPDGGCGTQPVGVNVGQITPFTYRDPSRFRPDGPNPLTSNAYTEDFIETRDYGRFNSTLRTAEETDIAYFWQAADVHRGFIDLAVSHGLNVRDTARFFALPGPPRPRFPGRRLLRPLSRRPCIQFAPRRW